MINVTFVIAGNTHDAPSSDLYIEAAKRFADTYRLFQAGVDHRLILINSNCGFTDKIARYFDGINYSVINYFGSGWDIGAHQFAAMSMDPHDWIMCFSSWAHFRQKGWLHEFVKAKEKFGDGLYGSTSSFEIRPHVRGTGFFTPCKFMQLYPHGCNSRIESLNFEFGERSFTIWCQSRGGVYIVTPRQILTLGETRNLINGFRRGDQSDILTFDKHTDLYESANEGSRTHLTLTSYPSE